LETRARRRRWLWTVLVAVIAVCFVPAFPDVARAADDYPYRDGDSSELDERGFYYRHCTSFVAWRMSQRGEFHNYMLGGHWWHARNWAANAAQIGLTVDTRPARGAIAHWNAGEQGADDLGHVAFVESVHADGSVTVEEYNGTNQLGYSSRGPTRAPRYIHVYDDAVPESGPTAEVDAPSSPVPVEPVVLHVAARSAPAAIEAAPDVEGELVAPSHDSPLRSGERVTVAAVFADDPRISEVQFIATDGGYRWEPIGTVGVPERWEVLDAMDGRLSGRVADQLVRASSR
jgi:surface antigen